jgi:hypothetical protein
MAIRAMVLMQTSKITPPCVFACADFALLVDPKVAVASEQRLVQPVPFRRNGRDHRLGAVEPQHLKGPSNVAVAISCQVEIMDTHVVHDAERA